MKILLLIPSLHNGGAERVAARLSHSLESRGHDPLVVTFSEGEVDYPVSNHIAMGIEPSTNFVKKTINVFRRINRLKKIKQSFLPDTSISFMFGANLVNSLTRVADETIVTSIRGSVGHKEPYSLMGLINSIVFNKSDYIVPVSYGIKEQLLQKYSMPFFKIKVIHNFTDVDTNIKSRKTIQKDIQLITMGRLESVKGQWHILYALRDLIQRNANISLIILGQGSLRADLENLITKLGLEKHVNLLGYQQDIHKFLLKTDIFLLSSKSEGLPNVLLEAMSRGLPIISTDIPHGPKEILNPEGIELYSNDEVLFDNKYGLLVDYGNNPRSNEVGYSDPYIVGQFVEKVTLLINNQKLYHHYSRQSLKRIKDFSEEVIIQKWIELFNSFD